MIFSVVGISIIAEYGFWCIRVFDVCLVDKGTMSVFSDPERGQTLSGMENSFGIFNPGIPAIPWDPPPPLFPNHSNLG